MNAKKILAMILVLSLLVIGGVMQIAASNGNTAEVENDNIVCEYEFDGDEEHVD